MIKNKKKLIVISVLLFTLSSMVNAGTPIPYDVDTCVKIDKTGPYVPHCNELIEGATASTGSSHSIERTNEKTFTNDRGDMSVTVTLNIDEVGPSGMYSASSYDVNGQTFYSEEDAMDAVNKSLGGMQVIQTQPLGVNDLDTTTISNTGLVSKNWSEGLKGYRENFTLSERSFYDAQIKEEARAEAAEDAEIEALAAELNFLDKTLHSKEYTAERLKAEAEAAAEVSKLAAGALAEAQLEVAKLSDIVQKEKEKTKAEVSETFSEWASSSVNNFVSSLASFFTSGATTREVARVAAVTRAAEVTRAAAAAKAAAVAAATASQGDRYGTSTYSDSAKTGAKDGYGYGF